MPGGSGSTSSSGQGTHGRCCGGTGGAGDTACERAKTSAIHFSVAGTRVVASVGGAGYMADKPLASSTPAKLRSKRVVVDCAIPPAEYWRLKDDEGYREYAALNGDPPTTPEVQSEETDDDGWTTRRGVSSTHAW